jgi:predicted Zn-ribbon and HTH transcriptional regulator
MTSKTIELPEFSKTIELPTLTCQRCGYTWTPRQKRVHRCPNSDCRSRKWNVPKADKPNTGSSG